MAQHDYVIANGTGAAVRSDLNNALAAIVSQNSGSTEPATTYAYMMWPDTTAGVMKMRNGANSAWIELFELDGEFGSKTFNGNITLNAQGDLRFADSDSSNWVAFQSPATVSANVTWTLPSADGTNGQALTTNGSGTLSWTSPAATTDKITEGNTEAEVVDTGSDGHFKVTTEGTERFRCDSSGRLLVGTSSASTATSAQYARIQIVGHTGGTETPGRLVLRRNETSSNISFNEQIGQIFFGDNEAGEYALIECASEGTAGSGDNPGRLVFAVTADGAASPTEAMRINYAGELLVGYTADNGAYKLQVNSQIFATSATIATSDGRYKENVATLGGSLDLVKALRPVSFTWKPQQNITRIDGGGNEVLVREGHNFPKGIQVGFIAQEVQKVLAGKPWLGSIIKENVRPAIKDSEGKELAPEEQFFGIAEGNLIAVLTNALQEAITKIETLEAKVAALEAS